MKIPTITYFTCIPVNPDSEDSCSLRIFADSPEKAAERISGCSDKWKIDGGPVTQELIHCKAIAEIMSHVPGEWEFESIEGRAIEYTAYVPGVIRKSDGMELYFSSPDVYGHKGKWEIRHAADNKFLPLYNEKGERMFLPSVGSSASKAPEKIAADIIRRLLPEAEKCQIAYLARKKAIEASENAQLHSLETICAALGLPVKNRYNSTEKQFEGISIVPASGSYSHGYGSVSINCGGSVEIKLSSLPLEKAEKLARLIKEIL